MQRNNTSRFQLTPILTTLKNQNNFMKRTTILLSVLLYLFTAPVHAQFLDSLLIQVGTTGTFATKDYQPLWITAQHYGALTDRKSDLSTQVGFTNMHVLGNNDQFYIKYGAYLNNNDHFNKVFVQEGYLKLGYKNLELGRDPGSTRWLQDIIWQTGRELGFGKVFVDRQEGVGGDDHDPFLRAGVEAVDVIQLTTYPHWHRADDTIDKVSAQSMKIVGDTILASLPKIADYVMKNKKQAVTKPQQIQE